MDSTTLIGYVASTLTTTAFAPQVYKTWKTKSAKDISLMMFLMMCFGVAMWIVYGVLRQDMPLIIGNIVTLLLCSVILYYKIIEPKS